MIPGIDVVFLHARRTELARWYAETLGVEVISTDGTWTELCLPGGMRFATDVVAGQPSDVERQRIPIRFAASDLRAEVRRLASRDVSFRPSASDAVSDLGPARVTSLPDPDVDRVRLAEPKRRDKVVAR